MTYCRWSCMEYKCDIYLYANCEGGFDICLAKYRLDFDASGLPVLPEFGTLSNEEWVEKFLQRNRMLRELLKAAPSQEIGLPYAGDTILASTAKDCIEKLKELKKLGYRFPDDVISKLEDECDESNRSVDRADETHPPSTDDSGSAPVEHRVR